jgi:hypothetical protein
MNKHYCYCYYFNYYDVMIVNIVGGRGLRVQSTKKMCKITECDYKAQNGQNKNEEITVGESVTFFAMKLINTYIHKTHSRNV